MLIGGENVTNMLNDVMVVMDLSSFKLQWTTLTENTKFEVVEELMKKRRLNHAEFPRVLPNADLLRIAVVVLCLPILQQSSLR